VHNSFGTEVLVIVILTLLEIKIGNGVAELSLQHPAPCRLGSEGIIEDAVQKCHKKITLKR